jgi:hypothetical protein
MTQVEPHITAEESINPKPGVWVMLTTFSFAADFGTYVHHFEIATSAGYRATLPACLCDRTPCDKASCGASTRNHCHYGHHLLNAQSFATRVAKTYGSGTRTPPPVTGLVGTARGRAPKMSEREWMAARGEIPWSEV